MRSVDIYRDDLLLTSIKPENESSLSQKIMGEDQVKLIFRSNQRWEFIIGDRANFWGVDYFLSEAPIERKESTILFRYELTFRSSAYMLSRVQYLFLGDDNTLKESDFSLTGKPEDFINLLIKNLKRISPEFNFSTYEMIAGDYKTITFKSIDCLSALGKIAEAYETEYFISGGKISLIKYGKDTGKVFRVGSKKGLYELTRKGVDSANLVTRIYPFGGDKNLPEGYRNFSRRLKIPPLPRAIVSDVTYTRDGQEYTFNWTPPNTPGTIGVRILSRFWNAITRNYGQWGRPVDYGLIGPYIYNAPGGIMVQFKFQTILDSGMGEVSGVLSRIFLHILDQQEGSDPALPLPVTDVVYLEKNINKYGVHEQTKVFEEIYPSRLGTVTSIDVSNELVFHDSGIDFNVNDYLLPGLTAKVTFNTGQLSGFTLEILKYEHDIKKFTLLANFSEPVMPVPSPFFKPAIGDRYVLTDIYMPQTYIDDAEQRLQQAAQEYLNTYSEPLLSYSLSLDPVYLRKKNFSLSLGDLIWIVDDQLNVKKKMRIVELKRNIVEEFQFEVEVSDEVSVTRLERIERALFR